MPFQLIHTSSPHLLDSAVSGYGTVARSVDMPAALYTQLPALSVLKESFHGPQFSYRILTACGEAWHVLSCVQPAGADYSGRACHIAHHLIFTQQEAAALLRHPLRPTPAGISLLLLQSGFWVKQWQGEPQLLESTHAFELEKLHDASLQPVWKHYTGHKANARAFYTEPYHRESVVIVPAAMRVEEILALLHESDWLSHTRGWGRTYTTAADESDHFSDTLRIFVSQSSPLVRAASRTGHPVLHINAELELPVQPPPSVTLAPGQQHSMVQTLARSSSHYHYSEEADWLLFDIPQPASPYKKALLAGVAGIACCTALALWYGCSDAHPCTTPSPGIREGSLCPSGSRPYLTRLEELLAAPADHEATQRMMHDLSLQKGSGVEDAWMAECATLIKNAGAAGVNHAAALKRICECARLLGLNDTALTRLYIREALYARSVEEWQRISSSVQTEEWLRLQLAEPAVARVFAEPEFQSYAPGTAPPGQEDKAPLLVTASPEPAPETTADIASAPASRVSLIPHPARCGEDLPRPLAEALTRLPLTITTGRYIISPFNTGDSLQGSKTLDLSEEGYRLHLEATENNGDYRLRLSHRDGRQAPVPEITLSVSAGKLRSIRCGEGFAVLSFPVPQQGEFFTNIILAPEFGIPLPEGKGAPLPEASTLDFQLTPAALGLRSSTRKPELFLSPTLKERGFPWSGESAQADTHRFSISLPVLNSPNSLLVTQEEGSAFTCTRTTLLQESDSQTVLQCDIEHHPLLPQRLESSLNRIANTPACGQRLTAGGEATLAELYAVLDAMDKPKLSAAARRKLHQRYFKLLTDAPLHAELCRILPAHQHLLLSPAEAGAAHFRHKRQRQNISNELDKPDVRDSIRKEICRMLSRSLLAAYEQAKSDFEDRRSKRPTLMLQRISQGEHGELLWHFHIQTSR